MRSATTFFFALLALTLSNTVCAQTREEHTGRLGAVPLLTDREARQLITPIVQAKRSKTSGPFSLEKTGAPDLDFYGYQVHWDDYPESPTYLEVNRYTGDVWLDVMPSSCTPVKLKVQERAVQRKRRENMGEADYIKFHAKLPYGCDEVVHDRRY